MHNKLLVIYMTLGYPDINTFIEFIKGAVNYGADVLEIGIPPKYAKYDGPVIRKSYDVVRSKIKDIWNVLNEVRKNVNIPIVALTYLEDWISELDLFLSKLESIGVDGVLFPDLLIDYIDNFDKYVKVVKNRGLKNVVFTSPSVPDSLIQKVSKISDIFLYYGVRPTTGIPIPVSVKQLITRVRNLVENKLVVGFGLSDEKDLRDALYAGADGIAIGTLFIEEIEKNGINKSLELVKKFREILDEF